MSLFPTLSRKPEPFTFEEEPVEDSTITSKFENGSVQSRAKFTSVPKQWTFSYVLLTSADKSLLTVFEKSVNYAAGSFSWVNPQDDNTYQVRFARPVKFNIDHKPDLWSANIMLVETVPNSENSILVETIIASNVDISTSDITMIGQILNAGDQVDVSDLTGYFEYGSDINSLHAVDFTFTVNVSDFKTGAKTGVFALESNILVSFKDFYYRAVVKSDDDASIGYGEIKSITSDLLGYGS